MRRKHLVVILAAFLAIRNGSEDFLAASGKNRLTVDRHDIEARVAEFQIGDKVTAKWQLDKNVYQLGRYLSGVNTEGSTLVGVAFGNLHLRVKYSETEGIAPWSPQDTKALIAATKRGQFMTVKWQHGSG